MDTVARLEEAIKRANAAGDYQSAMTMLKALEARTVVGAPFDVRRVVGNARSRQDQLATLQQWYPDARDTGDNFVYTDQDGNRTLYNEPGLDLGDVAEYSRVLPEMLGAAAGSFIGIPGGLPGMIAGAATGGATAGQAYDLLTPTVDTRTWPTRAQDTAIDLIANAVPGPNPRVPSSPAVRNFLSTRDELVRARFESTLDDMGVKLSVAQRTGWGPADTIENWLESTPFGGPVIRDQREAAAAGLGEYGGRVMPTASLSPTGTGQLVRESVEDTMQAKRNMSTLKYKAIESAFRDLGNSKMSPIPVDNLAAVVDDIQRVAGPDNPFGSLIADSNINRLSGALDGPDPSYELVKQYRSRLGEMKKDPLLQSQGASNATVKRLYGAASRDLENAAELLGGDAGVQARRAADKYHRATQEEAKYLDKALRGTDSDIFQRLERDFYRNPKSFKQVMKAVKALDKKNREPVMAELFRRMGMARPGAQDATGELFSPPTFMTNYNKMMREAPESFASFTREQRQSIKNIVEVANILKMAERNVNKSRTSLASQTGAGVLGLGAALIGGSGWATVAAGLNAIPYILAKAMTSDTLAKELAHPSFDPQVFAEVLMRRAAGPLAVEAQRNEAESLNDLIGVIAP